MMTNPAFVIRRIIPPNPRTIKDIDQHQNHFSNRRAPGTDPRIQKNPRQPGTRELDLIFFSTPSLYDIYI